MLSSLNSTPAVKHILIINVIIFILMNFVPQLGIYYEDTVLYYFDDSRFEFWQIITHMFQHARLKEPYGIMHIFFNMFVLFQFGTILEKHWGTKRFLIFYFFAGIGSAIFFSLNLAVVAQVAAGTIFPFSTIADISTGSLGSAAGASGAISGIIAAFAYLHPNTKLMLMFIPIAIKAKYMISAVFLFDLAAGILSTLTRLDLTTGILAYSDGIAHFAHVGGAVFGIVLVLFWRKTSNTFY